MGTTNPEKNLEEKIKETGRKLESPPPSAEELLSLLDETEGLLARVDQSPSPAMTTALRPMMTALAVKGMLSHPDTDVRVAVASCISEVTRITAPDAPYEDDLMKELFKRIVESFAKLDDLTSRTFSKRVSILETVAKVRSCVVMLDLECDDLVLEMFQHFLKTISLKHQENIFSSMETIMSLVIEESEEISKELVSCLLQSVKKERMERLSVSFKLGEKVIRNCADKLKPLLMELVGDRASDYSKFVMSLCQETSEAMDQSDIEASAKNMPEESKMSERTVSDERPQESAKAVEQEPEAECPDEVGSAAQNGEEAPPPVVDGNGESIVEEPSSPKQKAERPSRIIKKTPKAKEAETKGTPAVKSNKRKAPPAKQTESSGSQEVLSDKKEEEGGPKTAEPDSTTPVPEPVSKQKKGRAGSAKKTVDAQKEVVEGASDSEGRSLRQSVRKGAAASGDAKKKGGTKSRKKEEDAVPAKSKKKEEEVAPAKSKKKEEEVAPAKSKKKEEEAAPAKSKKKEEEAAPAKSKKKEEEAAPAKSKKKEEEAAPAKSKKKEEEAAPAYSDGEDSEDIRVKDMISAKVNAKSPPKQKANVGEASGSKRKRVPEKEKDEEKKEDKQASGGKKQKKVDESIIGERVKVWWPDDKAFYTGTVEKYNRSDKRHTIAYDDGDIEVLFLKDEIWELLEEEDEDTRAPDSSKSKKAKTSSVKEMNETPKAKSAAKSKVKEPAETPKTATSSKKDAKSKEVGSKTPLKSKSNGPPEKASGAKPAGGAKSSGKRKGGRN